MIEKKADVIISGGGMAGLSLAYQLKSANPDIDVLVLEKNTFPVPEAIAKIGESTVELGSHYLKKELELSDHFTDKHLRKFGIRCFFGQPQSEFEQQDELGTSEVFGLPTYQIDRGVLENHLHQKVTDLGVRVLDGVSTDAVNIGDNDHQITVKQHGENAVYTSQWFIDAAGRRALLKSSLGLKKENPHKGNAFWFRIDKRIEIDDWSDSEQWRQRCKPQGHRWLSTNHMMGAGYWTWVIPLASGVTSVGVVLDDQALQDSEITDADSAMRWLHQEQPRLANAVGTAEFMDFALVQDYALDTKQTFSEKGWGLTGEAGVFADPFYSPGTDFIAISNMYLKHLILSHYSGNDILLDTRILQKLYQSFFTSTQSLYTEQYGGFGDRKMMGLKLLWDYSYYWGVLSLLFFTNTMTDIALMRELNKTLHQALETNKKVQSAFRQRAEKRLVLPAKGLFMNQYNIPCLQYFNKILDDTDNIDVKTQMPVNVEMLEHIAESVMDILASDSPDIRNEKESEMIGNYRQLINA